MVSKPTGKPNGRPPKMTPETVNKLEMAFSIGCTDDEACLYADITRTTLFNYCQANPEFIDRKALLKQKVCMKARDNVAKKVNSGDIAMSVYVLDKADGKARQTVAQTGADGIGPVENKLTIEFVNSPNNDED